MILTDTHWIAVTDGDPRATAIFRRHYTCRDPHVDYERYGFSGNGESLVLLTIRCDALFCWRLVSNEGVNCSVFRNESALLSSELIRAADELAWSRWAEPRHYTYVNADKIRSINPGYCFIKAGWRHCGISKGGLHILEIIKS